MAWEKTHTVQVASVDKRQIWKVWTDVNNWHLWDEDIEFARIEQPFARGSSFVLKPKAGPRVTIKLDRVEREAGFTDVTTFPLARMYGIHDLKETAEGLEITHTVRIEGPLSFLWRRLVAEKVAAGLEEQASRMIQRAQEVEPYA